MSANLLAFQGFKTIRVGVTCFDMFPEFDGSFFNLN